MRKLLSLVMMLTLLVSLGFQAGLASAAPGSATSPHLARSQDIGDPVTISDIDGNKIGTVTVTDFEDNFADFSEKKVEDLQYVSIGLSIENTSDDPIAIEPGNIAVVDDRGLIYTDIVVTRDDNADELESGEIAAGETMDGYIEIGFPIKRNLAQVAWVVGQGQLVTIMNLADPIAEGDAVRLYNKDYTRLGAITTEQVVIGFDDFAKGLKIQKGYTVVAATFTIDNTGDEDLIPDPASFYLATTDGVFWQPDTSIERSDDAIDETPNLTDDAIAADETV
ncbi:MAG TPA: DUF4352 domain-containing protein, partial [Thermomicrobiales bacterium]|nr:DUF4352 domain-containing protein [Thermomicrobiales bacterium]